MKKRPHVIGAIALLLALAVLLSCSCSGSPAASSASNPSGSNPDSSSGYDSLIDGPKTYGDDPIIDMNGYTFTIASPWLPAVATSRSTQFEQLLHERIKEVEKAYNCDIKIVKFWAEPQAMQPRILANDKIADIIEMMPEMYLPASQSGYIVPLNKLEGINVNDLRWVESYTRMATMDGNVWGLQFTRPPEVRGCVFFNKDLLKNNGITEDLYQLVDEGKWDFDTFRRMAMACLKDTDNDNRFDTFGVATHAAMLTRALIEANGGRLATMVDGKVVATYNSQNVINALNFADTLVNVDKSYKTHDYMLSEETINNGDGIDDVEAFLNGEVAFLISQSWIGNQRLKTGATKIHYGMLPLPKGPDATDYVSPSENYRVFTITSKNTDLDKTIPIFNALARPMEGYEGEDWWMEEVQKDYFQDDDTRSADMYKLCLDKSQIDLGYGLMQLHQDVAIQVEYSSIFWKRGTPASCLAALTPAVYQEQLNALFNK